MAPCPSHCSRPITRCRREAKARLFVFCGLSHQQSESPNCFRATAARGCCLAPATDPAQRLCLGTQAGLAVDLAIQDNYSLKGNFCALLNGFGTTMETLVVLNLIYQRAFPCPVPSPVDVVGLVRVKPNAAILLRPTKWHHRFMWQSIKANFKLFLGGGVHIEQETSDLDLKNTSFKTETAKKLLLWKCLILSDDTYPLLGRVLWGALAKVTNKTRFFYDTPASNVWNSSRLLKKAVFCDHCKLHHATQSFISFSWTAILIFYEYINVQ